MNEFKTHFMLLLTLISAGMCDQYFEKLVDDRARSAVNEKNQPIGRNAVRSMRYKWPNAIVPYTFSKGYTKIERSKVLDAMFIFQNLTCVKFIPKTIEHIEHIRFLKSSKYCSSIVGFRSGRSQPHDVSYTQHCLSHQGAMQHEMLHVLGLVHEQCRPDRDSYLEIIWENIEENSKINFNKMPSDIFETFNLPYDYKSLMHYPGYAFAKSGANVTMYAKIDRDMELGQTVEPTFYDLEKVRRMYDCQSEN